MENQLVPQLMSTREYLHLEPFNGAGAEIPTTAHNRGVLKYLTTLSLCLVHMYECCDTNLIQS